MSAIGQQKLLGQLEGENEKDKVDLILHRTGERSGSVEVRSLRWGPGVGWYVQKTITLPPSQMSRLALLLRRFSRASDSRSSKPKIIPFPKK